MKKIIRIAASLLVLAAFFIWAATGANLGWTKTSEPIKTMDEVTGIEGIIYENKFQPGVDFLGAALLGAAVLTGVSFLLRAKSNNNQTKP